MDEDTEAYEAVVAAYRLPKATDDEKAHRKTVISLAMSRATEVPMRTAEACLVVLKAAGEAAANGNSNAISDARTGAALAWAGLVGAAENVRINAQSQGSGADLLESLDSLLAEGRSRGASVGLPPL